MGFIWPKLGKEKSWGSWVHCLCLLLNPVWFNFLISSSLDVKSFSEHLGLLSTSVVAIKADKQRMRGRKFATEALRYKRENTNPPGTHGKMKEGKEAHLTQLKYFLGYIGLIWATSSIPEDGCYSLLGFEGAALSFLCQELIRGWFLLGLGANPFHKTDAPLHHPEIPEALPRCQVHTCCNLPDKPGNNCPFDIFFFICIPSKGTTFKRTSWQTSGPQELL